MKLNKIIKIISPSKLISARKLVLGAAEQFKKYRFFTDYFQKDGVTWAKVGVNASLDFYLGYDEKGNLYRGDRGEAIVNDHKVKFQTLLREEIAFCEENIAAQPLLADIYKEELEGLKSWNALGRLEKKFLLRRLYSGFKFEGWQVARGPFPKNFLNKMYLGHY